MRTPLHELYALSTGLGLHCARTPWTWIQIGIVEGLGQNIRFIRRIHCWSSTAWASAGGANINFDATHGFGRQ